MLKQKILPETRPNGDQSETVGLDEFSFVRRNEQKNGNY